MENNPQNNNLFKGQISEKIYFDIFGLPNMNIIFYSSMLLLISAIAVIFILPSSNEITASMKPVVLILGAVIISLSILLKKLFRNNFAKNTLYSSKIFGNYNEVKIEWNMGDFVRTTIPWTAFERYTMKKRGIILFYDFDQRILVHKNFFENENEWIKIRQIVKRSVPKSGILLG